MLAFNWGAMAPPGPSKKLTCCRVLFQIQEAIQQITCPKGVFCTLGSFETGVKVSCKEPVQHDLQNREEATCVERADLYTVHGCLGHMEGEATFNIKYKN